MCCTAESIRLNADRDGGGGGFYFEVLLILYIIIIYDLVVSRVCEMQCAAVCILYAEIIAGWRYYNKTDYYY